MSPEQVQAILSDFANRARRVGTRLDGAEIWQFDVDGNAYELHYWVDGLKNNQSAAAATREFTQLQALQKLGIPATRVIANLKGFMIGQRKGDACIIVLDRSAVPLRQTLTAPGVSLRERGALAADLIARLETLYRHKLCPAPLTVDRFAVRRGQIIVADGAGEMGGLITDERLRELDASTRFVTHPTERLRFWKHFRDSPPPSVSRGDAAALVRDAIHGEGAFGRIVIDDWVGVFVRKVPMVVPWLERHDATISPDAWSDALPALLRSDDGKAVKNDRSGSVRHAVVNLTGHPEPVLVKRPAFKPGFRGAVQRFRVSRVLRTWRKTWRMLGLGFRCEVPLLMLERRSGPRLIDQLIVFARVPGPTMANIELDALSPDARSGLLRACGQTLRRIEALRFTHADAKNTNWIAWTDPHGIVRPVMIDLDGIRFYPWRGLGIERFVRAMKTHPQITAQDLRAIEGGYDVIGK